MDKHALLFNSCLENDKKGPGLMHENLFHALKKKNGEALNVHFQKWFKARLKQDSFFEKGKGCICKR